MDKPPINPINKIELSKSEQDKNIREVFMLHPELQEIGTKEQYVKYLETIFPESVVKDILWHYSDAMFKDEGFKPMKPNFDTLNSLENIYNFSTNKTFVTRFGEYAYPVLLNIKKPYETSSTGEYVDDMDRPLSEALFKIGKQTEKNILAPKYDEKLKDRDAVINSISGEDYVERHPVSGKEFGIPNQKIITVFNKDQIHILGSQSDFEKFKESLKKTESKD